MTMTIPYLSQVLTTVFSQRKKASSDKSGQSSSPGTASDKAGRLFVLVGFLILYACNSPALTATSRSSPTPKPTPTHIRLLTYQILNSYPHDRTAFTQGLVFDSGFLYESTGLRGHSTLRKVDLETGMVLESVSLAADYFGEGITILGDQIIQLTLSSGVGLVYDKHDLSPLSEFKYLTAGWGITHDGHLLIMSDGSSTLRFLDPNTLEVKRLLEVAEEGQPVADLNELEYIAGEIFANVWKTDRIVRISPETGQVLGWIDLEGLLDEEEWIAGTGVLNGIAYDAQRDRLFVTGKNWPKIFEIDLLPVNGP